MPAWRPILVLPNIDIQYPIIGKKGGVVGREDPRIHAIIVEHPIFGDFLERFTGQFTEPIQPSALLVKSSAGKSYSSAQAVGGLRDLTVASVVPLARARRLIQVRAYSQL